MKVKKTITIDTKGIEIGDTFYKFSTYDAGNPKAFYEGQRLVIKDIRFEHRTPEITVCWDVPVKNGTLPENHKIIDFKGFGNKDEKGEEDIHSFTTFCTTGMAGNPSFNFYVMDKKGQVQKEIEKRKEHIRKKIEKELLDAEENIKKNKEILKSIK